MIFPSIEAERRIEKDLDTAKFTTDVRCPNRVRLGRSSTALGLMFMAQMETVQSVLAVTKVFVSAKRTDSTWPTCTCSKRPSS